MSTTAVDPINVKTPSREICVKSYYDPKVFAALKRMETRSVSGAVNTTVAALIDNVIDLFGDKAVEFVEDYGKYLQSANTNLWNASAFLTGNFRASLKMSGNFQKDPVGCGITFDMEWFTTEKWLPMLHSITYDNHVVWTTKDGTKHENTYHSVRKAGTMKHITGEDYTPRVPPVKPYVFDYLNEIDNVERQKAGVN